MNEMKIMRVFGAPKNVLYKAWTEPESIKQWWGPKGFSAPIIKVDLRKGGKYLYAMQDEAGKLYWSGGVFKEVTPNRLILTDYFSDENGNKLDPVDYGMDPNFPKESDVTVKFEEVENRTRVSIIYKLPESEKVMDAIKASQMEEGWNSSLDKLQDLVETR